MGTSSGFKNTNFIESDRRNGSLSHSEFAIKNDFSDQDNCDKLERFLMLCDYDKYFRFEGRVKTVDTEKANQLFYKCYTKFKNETDLVIIFDTITKFYDIEPSVFLNKLVKKLRILLIKDLKQRLEH